MKHIASVEAYCFASSWRLRRCRNESRWLIGIAADQLPDRAPIESQDRYDDWQTKLDARLRDAVHHRCGSPVLVWLLLNVVLPVVVRLVLDWWFNRKE